MQIIAIIILVLSFLQGGEDTYTVTKINGVHSVTVKSNQLYNVEYNYYEEYNCYEELQVGDIVIDKEGVLEVYEVHTYKVIDIIDNNNVLIVDTHDNVYEVYQEQDCLINFEIDDHVIIVDNLMLVCEDNNSDYNIPYGEHMLKECDNSLVLYTHDFIVTVPYNITHDYNTFK